MEALLENILSLLKKDGRPTGDFTRALGLPASAVSDWRAKKSRSYTKYLPLIANYFGITVDMLINGYAEIYTACTDSPGKLPIVSRIPESGAPVTADNIEGFDFACLRFSHEYFFFRPRDEENTLYLIHRQNYADDGDTVLIRSNGTSLICAYNTHASNIIYTPNNSEIPPMCFSEALSRQITVGTVTEIRKKIK